MSDVVKRRRPVGTPNTNDPTKEHDTVGVRLTSDDWKAIKEVVEEKEAGITPDAIFDSVATKNYEEAERDLLTFVERQVELMKEHLLFGGEDIPSFYSLNKALMDYESVLLGLTSLHAEVRVQLDVAKEKYDDFYAHKYVETKQSHVSLGKNAPFTTAKEIEMYVRKNYLKELSKLKAEVIRIENQYNTVNHLINGWQNYQFVLSTLSKNAQAEAQASGVSTKNPKSFGDENI